MTQKSVSTNTPISHITAYISICKLSKNYRAVGQLDGDTVIWFWVGSHAEYDKFLGQL
ncbi:MULTISPECIES: ParE family toxin-like protein [unclassified Microcoleus]|uniref:ParE family toxin-like protein n=1 Tax=unclassified Microcoleus TaxID=2642155 RepID=UPI004040BE33